MGLLGLHWAAVEFQRPKFRWERHTEWIVMDCLYRLSDIRFG